MTEIQLMRAVPSRWMVYVPPSPEYPAVWLNLLSVHWIVDGSEGLAIYFPEKENPARIYGDRAEAIRAALREIAGDE